MNLLLVFPSLRDWLIAAVIVVELASVVGVTVLAIGAMRGNPRVVVAEPEFCALEWGDLDAFVRSARADIEAVTS